MGNEEHEFDYQGIGRANTDTYDEGESWFDGGTDECRICGNVEPLDEHGHCRSCQMTEDEDGR